MCVCISPPATILVLSIENTYGDAWQYYHSTAQPAIVAYCDGQRILQARLDIAAHADIQRMVWGVQLTRAIDNDMERIFMQRTIEAPEMYLHVWCEEAVVPNDYRGAVQKDVIVVAVKVLPERDVVSIVTEKVGLDVRRCVVGEINARVL